MKHGLRQKIKAGLEKTGEANYVPKGLRRKIKIIEKSESTFLLEKTIWFESGIEIQNESVLWKLISSQPEGVVSRYEYEHVSKNCH
jgi:hypothetical protein